MAVRRGERGRSGPARFQPPLLVFVGHTVQTGKTESQLNAEDKASLSDVLNMVRFLARVVRDEDGWAVRTGRRGRVLTE